MTPQQYCQDKAARSGSSFYYSFMFLPPPRRAAITALYAFCREVDDVVDECPDPSLARVKLAWWRTELAALDGGAPTHPVTRALAPCMQEFAITTARLGQIIDGMEMDLTQNRYLDFAGLERYCFHVAGVVGLLAAGIFGATQADTLEYATRLGLAFQLTNIIRDVGEDALKGRVYIPMNELARFDIPVSDILARKHSTQFVELMRFQTDRARQYYREAFALLPAADRSNQKPGLVMAAIYQTLLDEIEADSYQVLDQRVSLTPLRKLWIAWRTWRRG
jgi:15-cis-phytoene synthase